MRCWLFGTLFRSRHVDLLPFDLGFVLGKLRHSPSPKRGSMQNRGERELFISKRLITFVCIFFYQINIVTSDKWIIKIIDRNLWETTAFVVTSSEKILTTRWIVNIPLDMKRLFQGVLNGIPSTWHHSLYQQRFKFSPVYSRCITCNFIFNVFMRFFLSFRSLPPFPLFFLPDIFVPLLRPIHAMDLNLR